MDTRQIPIAPRDNSFGLSGFLKYNLAARKIVVINLILPYFDTKSTEDTSKWNGLVSFASSSLLMLMYTEDGNLKEITIISQINNDQKANKQNKYNSIFIFT